MKTASESLADKKLRMASILKSLRREYPEAHCSLNYETPYQLLIATILSAQCTDDRVNQVTPVLFAKWPGQGEMSKVSLAEIETVIRSTGFYKAKAKSILECSKALIERHHGEVPNRLDDLVKLRGVGRKTANVVLGNAFGIPGLVVDTHVGRLCRRMGFTRAEDAVKVETEIEKLVDKSDWTVFSHLLIAHGRATCMARKPNCEHCVISRFCHRIGV